MDLKTFQRISENQRILSELYERRKTIYNTVHSPSLSGIKKTTPADPTARAFDKLQAIDDQIAQITIKQADLLEPVLNWMYYSPEPVPVDVARILINRYILRKSWAETGRTVEITPAGCKNRIYRYFKNNGPL